MELTGQKHSATNRLDKRIRKTISGKTALQQHSLNWNASHTKNIPLKKYLAQFTKQF